MAAAAILNSVYRS